MIGFLELPGRGIVININDVVIIEPKVLSPDEMVSCLQIHIRGDRTITVDGVEDCREVMSDIRRITELNFKAFQLIINR